MNVSSAELAALAQVAPGSVSSLLCTVVQLQRTGDAPVDPFRQAWGFADSARAAAFAAKLQSTARSSCVVTFQGTTQLTLTGDAVLVGLYMGRAGPTSPLHFDPTELNDIVVAAAKPAKTQAPVVDLGDYTAKRKQHGGG